MNRIQGRAVILDINKTEENCVSNDLHSHTSARTIAELIFLQEFNENQ